MNTATVQYVNGLTPRRLYTAVSGLTIEEWYDCDSHTWVVVSE